MALDNTVLMQYIKTAEVARLQIGEATNDVKVVVSTVAEAEHLVDLLVESREDGKNVNVPLPHAASPKPRSLS